MITVDDMIMSRRKTKSSILTEAGNGFGRRSQCACSPAARIHSQPGGENLTLVLSK